MFRYYFVRNVESFCVLFTCGACIYTKLEIVNVSVDERILDETGRVDVSKVKPITFDPFNNQYVGLGKIVGRAFKDGFKLK